MLPCVTLGRPVPGTPDQRRATAIGVYAQVDGFLIARRKGRPQAAELGVVPSLTGSGGRARSADPIGRCSPSLRIQGLAPH
jgi:hypothetical protein